MKNLNLFLVAIASCFFMISCGGGAGSSAPTAQDVATSFLNEMADADTEGAKEFANESTDGVLDMIKASVKKGDKPEKVECTEDGNTATCKVCCDPNGEWKENPVKLEKTGDKWEVNMTKEEMKKEDPINSINDAIQEGVDSLGGAVDKINDGIKEATDNH